MSGHGAPSTIYVGIRIRPFVPREISTNEKRCVECEAGQIFLKDLQKNTQQGFALDELMDSSVEKDHKYYYNQERVYLGIGKQFYEQVREGYNAALFAYGQTGSGKTTSVVYLKKTSLKSIDPMI